MILEIHKPEIETSSDFENTLFTIGDTGMILDIIRSKMYSNPIQSVCREIGCNARDAHREVKTLDVPIQITLPNTLEPFLKIKDFGPGLSPNRIKDVYTRYGVSSKRNDNTQTGAYGTGSKSPWSLSSDFSVETVVDGIQYLYSCYIDETNVGAIALLGSEKSLEPNSTEIKIPIKSADFNSVKENVEFTTRHWTTKPIVKGGIINYKTPVFKLSGEGWGIAEDYESYTKQVRLIIDGIEYPLNTEQLKGSATKVLNCLSYATIYLYFNTGDLSLSANRENVHLDSKTTDKILSKLDFILSDFKSKAQAKIDECKTLFEANTYFKVDIYNSFNDISFLGKAKWKNIELKNGTEYLDYKKATIVQFYRNSYRKDEISKQNRSNLAFTNESALYLNDLNIADLQTKHIKSLFSDKKLQSVQVISLVEKTSWEDLNKLYHLDQMGAKKLSEVTTADKPKKADTAPRLLTFKFDEKSKKFKQVSYDAMEADTNKKILCKLIKTKVSYYATNTFIRTLILDNGKQMDGNALSLLMGKVKDTSLYGVDKEVPAASLKGKFIGAQPFDTFVNKGVFSDKDINYAELKYANNCRYDLQYRYFSWLSDYQKKMTNKSSPFLIFLELQKKFATLLEEESATLNVRESLQGAISQTEVDKWLKEHPEKNIKKQFSQIEKRYPLLQYIDQYRVTDTMKEPMIAYINLIDTNNPIEDMKENEE